MTVYNADFVSHLLPDLVAACDAAAVQNVRSGHGGPFGASLSVYNRDSGALVPVAGPVCNAVLETGLAGAHAEDQVLQPAALHALRDALQTVGRGCAIVVLASSGESCPACYSKIEIVARTLVTDGLIEAGAFVLAYGASYEDTRVVAGFNDEPYHADMAGPLQNRMIPCVRGDGALPVPARVVMPDGAAYDGADGRMAQGTPLFTPEIQAIYTACRAQKKAGVDEPWNLRRAVLYTTAPAVGPLMYAESQWANIGRIVQCDGPVALTEAPDATNDALFAVVAARPYNGPGTAVHVVRVTPFANLAQHEWARLSEAGQVAHYNGIEA
ncbi:hypothetical protein [Micavibrio aeruginosavorus]|uniref:Cytidine deaminase n=1 Tax=Micavibrio aeruginosavorus EPB TaxID=349215 RepID=M4VLN7_9BACT|nr:hypothetical protein [Micavibrio aeruginosavorus]AGH99026.1 hypothetical protein A11S_2230 [Micavibrio aeruginosavorus EPB]